MLPTTAKNSELTYYIIRETQFNWGVGPEFFSVKNIVRIKGFCTSKRKISHPNPKAHCEFLFAQKLLLHSLLTFIYLTISLISLFFFWKIGKAMNASKTSIYFRSRMETWSCNLKKKQTFEVLVTSGDTMYHVTLRGGTKTHFWIPLECLQKVFNRGHPIILPNLP